jgi:preprotein translocase subunit SecG
MVVVCLIATVLLQKSEGGGLVSSTSGFLTGRGTANVLTRTTALLAAGFFVTSLMLSWLAGIDRKPASIVPTGGAPTQEAPPGPGAPLPPLSPPGGVLNQLKGGFPGASPGTAGPATPSPAPGGPEVPQSR